MSPLRSVVLGMVGVLWWTQGFSAQAQSTIVMDEFLVNQEDLTATDGDPESSTVQIQIESQNAQRQMRAEATLDFTLDTVVDGGVWLIDASGPSGTATATQDYLGFSLDLEAHIFLQLDFLKAIGGPLLVAELGNTSAGMTLSNSHLVPENEDPFSVVFDITAMPGYSPAFLNGFDSLTVFLAGGQPQFAAELDRIQLSEIAAAPPVPEPASWMLLALGAGWFYFTTAGRRRRKVS